MTGVVRDIHGQVLIELAREYRQVVTYDDVPPIVRQAILSAEDRRFFTHSGVDYRAFPRVVVGSTYGMSGITVAVRIGYDDNRPMGQRRAVVRVGISHDPTLVPFIDHFD